MAIQHLESLAAVVLAGSLAMERLVNLGKTLAPRIFGEPSPVGNAPVSIFDDSARTRSTSAARLSERYRRLAVLALVYVSSAITAWFIAGDYQACVLHASWFECPAVAYGSADSMPFWLYAILVSGGSAMWANLVGYFSALKDTTAAQRRGGVSDTSRAQVLVVNAADAPRLE